MLRGSARGRQHEPRQEDLARNAQEVRSELEGTDVVPQQEAEMVGQLAGKTAQRNGRRQATGKAGVGKR